ncbi:TonB-dependent receptor [Sphingobium sp. YR768]|uniref:TonB-dependent receptor n=1 Tax=Sphingobium sp. YR768 TaxID=1884365 RepID=UPI0008B9AA99|nr:TonB-dependent receptor [Sphingobium sp. YR768]SER79743.1 iron complex outermembrane recepter protein [Sphingobium sp. YR768]
MKAYWLRCGSAAVMSCALLPSPWTDRTLAQETLAAPSTEDIIVTARRREETLISTPVTIAAIGSEELSRRAIVNLEGIARTVPQLIIGNGSGSVQGGAIALRGVSAGDSNPFGDQAVAFNIDGVQVARAAPRRMGEFDMAQVEVLKGPQALYFGKNSPGGIVVIRTGDPTDRLEARMSAGYEAYGRELRGEAYVSGPISDTLGVRVAGYGSRTNGWVRDRTTPSALYGSQYGLLPHDREYGGRVTLKWEPSDALSARFKFAYGSVRTAGLTENTQRVSCPLGAPQLGGRDDCIANDTVVRSGLGPNFQALNARLTPDPYSRQQQYLVGLDIQYRLSDTLSLALQSGFYRNHLTYNENFNATDSTAANRTLGSAGELTIREISQELRLSSDFDGPFNFLVGGFFQDSRLDYDSVTALNAVTPAYISTPYHARQEGTAYSLFGSVSVKPVEDIEISGGARYSYERKRYEPTLIDGTPFDPMLPGGTAVPRKKWTNVSPEVTISYRPSSNLTLFASYKQGFLSGGFNAGNGNQGLDRSYDQQTVKGLEGGVKARLLGDRLAANLSLYDYKISGQQVTSLIGVTQIVTNAASSKTRGVEGNLNWRTPVDGLSLHGGASYNRARYITYLDAPCYAGQTIALGCDLNLVGGVYRAQSLSGAALPRAPKWGQSLGASYSATDTAGTRFDLSVDVNHTSGYFTDATNKPASFQRGYWMLDASAKVALASGIEFALVGRNLTNVYYFQRSSDNPLTGAGTGTATGFGADTVAYVSRGRELLLRFSVQLDKLRAR